MVVNRYVWYIYEYCFNKIWDDIYKEAKSDFDVIQNK